MTFAFITECVDAAAADDDEKKKENIPIRWFAKVYSIVAMAVIAGAKRRPEACTTRDMTEGANSVAPHSSDDSFFVVVAFSYLFISQCLLGHDLSPSRASDVFLISYALSLSLSVASTMCDC